MKIGQGQLNVQKMNTNNEKINIYFIYKNSHHKKALKYIFRKKHIKTAEQRKITTHAMKLPLETSPKLELNLNLFSLCGLRYAC